MDIMGFFDTLLAILNAMSPYLLLGFLIAGILHSFVSPAIYTHHLSDDGWKSVVKAAILGIPLPLCSCGVLPTAISLYRNGASKATTTSFLIATPQTGVDSIMATYSLLGPAFAIFRPIVALITSFVGGIIVGHDKDVSTQNRLDKADMTYKNDTSWQRKTLGALKYGYIDMMQSVGRWLVIGLVIAAIITVAVPTNFFAIFSWSPILSMIIIVIIAIPMYVCATGSIPIALSLMVKGLSPGVAFVLLMAGPAANFASVMLLKRTMGFKTTMKYVSTIVIGAMAFGLVIDYVLPISWFVPALNVVNDNCCDIAYPWFETICSSILIALLLYVWIVNPMIKKIQNTKMSTTMTKKYLIKGMSCVHCKEKVEKNLSSLPGVLSVSVNLSDNTAEIYGSPDDERVAKLIESLGYEYAGIIPTQG